MSRWYYISCIVGRLNGKYLFVNILIENGLAESLTGTTDACLISLIIEP